MDKLRVKIVTHTGCDMPLELAEQLGVMVIPDLVMFGEKSYRNRIDITSDEFYHRMEKSSRLPTSSHPSVGDFAEGFSSLGEYDEILFLSITSRMSGTYAAAVAAQKLLKEREYPVPVVVYDTEQCSHGMGIMVEQAAHMAREGLTAGEIIHRLNEIKRDIGVYFVLETLKYARKGGRVGAIKALAADTLGIKPLLKFDEGTVSDVGITRNFKEGLKAVLDTYKKQGAYGRKLIVFHAANPQGARYLEEMIKNEDPGCTVYIEPVGPVIGIYTGAGCVGMAYWKNAGGEKQ